MERAQRSNPLFSLYRQWLRTLYAAKAWFTWQRLDDIPLMLYKHT
jgi:hypothetical protein